MEALKQYFNSMLKSTGIPPTGVELVQYSRKKRLPGVTSNAVYSFLRQEAEPDVLGSFARRDKVEDRQTVSPVRPGVYYIDYAEFHKDWAGSNNGCTGFLVAVENLTNRLFVLPVKGKDTHQWELSVARFVSLSRQVSVIFSDRDSVATSETFRRKLADLYNLKWHFLTRGNKSFLAERYIGLVKTKLSQALLYADKQRFDQGLPPSRRWIDFVEPLVEAYNNQEIGQTGYKRRAVSRENFNDFVKRLMGGRGGSSSSSSSPPDPNYDTRFNNFVVPEFAHHPDWNRRIFRLNLGQRVRVSRKVDWSDPANRKSFQKTSTVGGFGNKIYTITGRQLRACKSFKKYVPVYQLSDMPNRLKGFCFYEKELVPVGGTGNGSSSSSSSNPTDTSVANATTAGTADPPAS
jgi:hypothetical protein